MNYLATHTQHTALHSVAWGSEYKRAGTRRIASHRITSLTALGLAASTVVQERQGSVGWLLQQWKGAC